MGFIIAAILGFALVAIFLGTGPRRDCPHCRSRYRLGAHICPRCHQAVPTPQDLDRQAAARTDALRQRDRDQLRAIGRAVTWFAHPCACAARDLRTWFAQLPTEGKIITTVTAAGSLAIAITLIVAL